MAIVSDSGATMQSQLDRNTVGNFELTEHNAASSSHVTVADAATALELEPTSRAQMALPPTDTGFQAWLALFGSFLSNALIWGLALSFGVLQEYYSNHEPFLSHPKGLAAIGTTATGLMYLTMPLFLVAFQRWPSSRAWSLRCSLPLVTGSLIGASFAENVPQLLVSQGVVYAAAGNALVMPNINYINEWFVRKKGLAIGISIAGDGVGGVVMPLILQALLSRLGFRWTLRVIALIIVAPSSAIIFFLKPRLPTSTAHVAPPVKLTFLRHRLFWLLQSFNIIQALGYFLPLNYLPSIAEEVNMSPVLGSLTVLLVNLGLVFGCIAVGALVDRFDVTAVTSSISFAAAISVFTALGFSTSLVTLYIFSILYGLTASAYSTNWGGIIKEMQRKYEGTDANLVFGLLAAGKGVGSIISGPLSESLVARGGTEHNITSSAYTSKYGPIIIFSGVTAAIGGCSWFFRKAGVI